MFAKFSALALLSASLVSAMSVIYQGETSVGATVQVYIDTTSAGESSDVVDIALVQYQQQQFTILDRGVHVPSETSVIIPDNVDTTLQYAFAVVNDEYYVFAETQPFWITP